MLNAAARIQTSILRGITFFITVAKREVVDRKIRCCTVVHVEFQCGISGISCPGAPLSCFVIYSKERTFHFFDHLLGRAELNEQAGRRMTPRAQHGANLSDIRRDDRLAKTEIFDNHCR